MAPSMHSASESQRPAPQSRDRIMMKCRYCGKKIWYFMPLADYVHKATQSVYCDESATKKATP